MLVIRLGVGERRGRLRGPTQAWAQGSAKRVSRHLGVEWRRQAR
jgi:hypothetical protein